ncbi:MAG: endonuclease V, partial [Candidatus Bathyarchaeota archaeon]
MRKRKVMEELQRNISMHIRLHDGFKQPINMVSGIDLSFIEDLSIASCVTCFFSSLEIVNNKTIVRELSIPYISTYLGFREGPPIIELINSIDYESNIFLINAHGIAHPRFCGCASYVGVLTQKPTIGVASTNLCGNYVSEPHIVEHYEPMYYNNRPIGWIFKSNKNCKPIFISPGHLVSLKSSLEIVN